MTENSLDTEIVRLKEVYGKVAMARGSGGQTLIRITEVPLPMGCSPSVTAALLVVLEGQPRPLIYVKPRIKGPNGVDPRSTSVVQVEGEEWLQFSYSFPWDENLNTLVQFVGASIQRFAKSE